MQDVVTRQRIAIFICPSEQRDEMKLATSSSGPGAINRYPACCAAAVGTWMAWNPMTGQGGDGAITYTSQPNGGMKVGEITDGTSNTVGYAEVKAYTWNMKSNQNLPASTPIPAPTPAAVFATITATTVGSTPSGHTSWTEAQTFHNGMTFVLTPNTQCLITDSTGKQYDVDVLTGNEGNATRITFSATTSRSYHSGGLVNVLLMDGSVRSVTSSIDFNTWHALGSKNGGEVVGSY